MTDTLWTIQDEILTKQLIKKNKEVIEWITKRENNSRKS